MSRTDSGVDPSGDSLVLVLGRRATAEGRRGFPPTVGHPAKQSRRGATMEPSPHHRPPKGCVSSSPHIPSSLGDRRRAGPIARRRFMSIVRDRTSTPIRTLLADPDSGDRVHGREVSCRLHEHQRCVTRKPRPTVWGNGSIKVPQPQRGVTRIQDSEFRPVGASNRLDSKTQAVGLG